MTTPDARARAIIPENRNTEISPSIARVVAALRDLGLRNAGTPLLMASTPVRAAQPWVNERRTRKTSASWVRSSVESPPPSGSTPNPALGATRASPEASRRAPTTIMPTMQTMKQ